MSDAIAATADIAAIRALLANPSAQIREATLDALVARSVDHPRLARAAGAASVAAAARSALMLSEIVAAHLLAELATRADLPPRAGRGAAAARRGAAGSDATEPSRADRHTAEEVLAQAHALAARGELGEEALLDGGAPGRGALCDRVAGRGRRHAGLGG